MFFNYLILTSVGLTTREQCEQAVLEVTGQKQDGSVKLFDVIGAFDSPRFIFDRDNQRFVLSKATLFTDSADHFTEYFRNRYNYIYQRVLRNPIFANKSVTVKDNSSNKYKLKPLEALYGCNVLMENITVFGMITQIQPGQWYIEDFNGAVRLDLSKVEYGPGLICDGTFVLCDGSYEQDVLYANVISLPPSETASVTRAQFGDINFFGGELTTCAAANQVLVSKEIEDPNAFIVFLSCVHLDNSEVMNKLHILFTGYSKSPPIAFVMCGPFVSPRARVDPCGFLAENLKKLGQLISSVEGLKEKSKFVFVPAMEDAGSLSVYPRPPLLSSVTAGLTKQVKSAIFTTNPCRIQYCTKEIVVFREDLIPKMFKCRVNSPKDNLTHHFTRTLVSAGNLALLPLSTMPVYWQYDHAMSLHPLPNLVIAADNYYPYTEESSGCIVSNPGSFPLSKFNFKVYYPASNEVEDSAISGDF
ncbi:POLE2 [Bugula neritina]|uniref:DNA polymerase II subunit 2 n=1 Tax=Bugula neritina TaxID=10212 RepID=A0A7J7JTJ6_BUGNE|nr:POLE2 [Bugula neritina]